MSCPTENTVVVKTTDSKLFARLWKDNECEHRLSDLKKVFENDVLAVFIFDCNGSPSFIDESSIFPLIVETYYLDNEEPVTDYDWDFFKRKDSTDCLTLLSQILSEEELLSVKSKISYSIPKISIDTAYEKDILAYIHETEHCLDGCCDETEQTLFGNEIDAYYNYYNKIKGKTLFFVMIKICKELYKVFKITSDRTTFEIKCFSKLIESMPINMPGDENLYVDCSTNDDYLLNHHILIDDYALFTNEETIFFSNGSEMLSLLKDGQDLYNKGTGEFVFLYNESGSIAVYYLNEKEVERLKKEVPSGESWSVFLGPGGAIYDDSSYEDFDETLISNIDWCKEHFKGDWTKV